MNYAQQHVEDDILRSAAMIQSKVLEQTNEIVNIRWMVNPKHLSKSYGKRKDRSRSNSFEKESASAKTACGEAPSVSPSVVPLQRGFSWQPQQVPIRRKWKTSMGMRDIFGARLPAHYPGSPEGNTDIWPKCELKMTTVMENVCDVDRSLLIQLRRVKRPFVVSAADDSDTLVRCGSKALGTYLDFKPQETLGRSFFDLFPKDSAAVAQIKTWLKDGTEHHTFLTLLDGSRIPTSSLSVSIIVLRNRANDPIYTLFVLKKVPLQVLPNSAKRISIREEDVGQRVAVATAVPVVATAASSPGTQQKVYLAETREQPQQQKRKRSKMKSESDPGQEKLLRAAAAAAAAAAITPRPIALTTEKKQMLQTILKEDPFTGLTSRYQDKTLFAGWPKNWFSLLAQDGDAKRGANFASRAIKRVRTMDRMDEMMALNPDNLACPRKYKRDAFLLTSSGADFPTIAVSESCEKMHGYSSQEFCGRNPRFLQGPKTSLASVKKLQDGLAKKGEAVTEIVNYRKDGSMYKNTVRLLPMQGKNGETSYLGFIRELDPEFQHLKDAEALLSLGSQARE